MNSKFLIVGLVIVVVGLIGFMITKSSGQQASGSKAESNGVVATIYKSPSCGCCGQYAAYLEGEGYGVEIESVTDMSSVKEEFGVPYELESCHTMEVGGYIVEGHVPEEAVQKLLTERPDIKGIGMAGMPSGSPGMPGPKIADLVIYEITHEGTKGNVYMTI